MTVLKIISWIILVVGWWKVYEKAEIKGWKALIPFYSDYVRFQLGDKPLLYIPYLILTIVEMITSFLYVTLLALKLIDFYGQLDMGMDLGTLNALRWIFMMVLLAIDILVGMRIAYKFGKSKWFGVGLGVIPLVFVLILAFGKTQYIGKKEYI